MERAERSTPGRRAAVLAAAASSLAIGGDTPRARPIAVAALTQGDPPDSPAWGLPTFALGLIDTYAGDATEALRRTSEMLRTLESESIDDWTRCAFRNRLDVGVDQRGDLSQDAHEAETLRCPLGLGGNPSNLVSALWALGWAILHEEPEAALAAFEESASLTRDGASDAVYGSALARIGTLRARLGDAIGALRALREAISFCHEIGNRTTVVGAIGCGVADTERARALRASRPGSRARAGPGPADSTCSRARSESRTIRPRSSSAKRSAPSASPKPRPAVP